MNRSNGVDVLKLLMAIFVVMIHANYPWRDYIIPITRCAVPCFFMISGYFLYKSGLNAASLKRSIKRMIFLLLWSTIFYILWVEFPSYTHTRQFVLPTQIQWLNFILFNDNPFAFHLWYLSAYLYVLFIVLIVKPNPISKTTKTFVTLALLTNLIFCSWSKYRFMGGVLSELLIRNFLFTGLPFFLIGGYIACKRETFEKTNQKCMVAAVLIFMVTSLLESYFLLRNNLTANKNLYISTIPLTICLFTLFQFHVKIKENLFTRIGRDDSLYIYIFHIVALYPINYLIIKTAEYASIHELLLNLKPFIAVVLVIVVTYIHRHLFDYKNKKIRSK